jgi:hypothetical protein
LAVPSAPLDLRRRALARRNIFNVQEVYWRQVLCESGHLFSAELTSLHPPPYKKAKTGPMWCDVTTPGGLPSWGVTPNFCAPGPPKGARTEKLFFVPGEAPGRYGKKLYRKTRPSSVVQKIGKKGPFFSHPKGREPLLQNHGSVSNFVPAR